MKSILKKYFVGKYLKKIFWGEKLSDPDLLGKMHKKNPKTYPLYMHNAQIPIPWVRLLKVSHNVNLLLSFLTGLLFLLCIMYNKTFYIYFILCRLTT